MIRVLCIFLEDNEIKSFELLDYLILPCIKLTYRKPETLHPAPA
jgi:hypothetical protein